MFKARDIMSTKVICARPEMPIYEAIRLLTRSNITGLPVVDDELKLVGIFSEKDVLQLLYDTKDDSTLMVKDFMSTSVVSFGENSSVIELCDCLLHKPFRRVPITQQGMLVDIISRTDVTEAILKLKHQENKKAKMY